MKHPLAILALALTVFGGCVGSSTSSDTVSAISLSPAPCGLSRTNNVQMTAEATFTNGSKRQLGAREATWTTEASDIVTVSETGVVVGVNSGIAAITASYQGATGTLNCTVVP